MSATKQAMKIGFLTATVVSIAALAQQPSASLARITIPGVEGALELNVGPTTWETRVRGDGIETQMQAMGRSDHLVISAFLQKVTFTPSAEKCRDEWWSGTQAANKSHGFKMEHLNQRSDTDIARVEYLVPEYQGKPVMQKNVHAYAGGGNLCAEIHLSKVLFSQDDQKLFEEVLKTVRLLPNDPAAQAQAQQPVTIHDSSYFLRIGSRFFLMKDYQNAAEQYQEALDLEKQKRTLNADLFRVLVDNLAIAYGISGNLVRSKETLEYGITQYPDYPLFYYNMAWTYGEMGKMDESLDQLRLAYKNKANMIAGETFPNPLKDDSFRKFVNNKKFLDAVHAMQ